ncbi:exodeoxyribonuclease V subunit gamma [Dokdonella sp.]|uniref:exodeoxyribonuclease V subunit gamma n=1 Tax=Dokdonella sp. TaxID=2291710 RepID=UPI001B0E134A|nr:exodeoxyribonuclease V subunit gamma [Dokdonella sp.]MBO9661605.1 exodeoxyribonuclease V subunit gamma [Dokdonella sp.]
MFHLHYGNDLRGLARVLGERIAVADVDALLTPEVVLVPHPGMRRWLEIELAEAQGIAANVDFRLPGEFVWQVLRANHAGLRQQSIYDRDVLRWRLFPLLAELAREPVGAPLAHYLRGDAAELKRLQLAREFAAALERYQAYRRGMLEEWERGAERDDWQAEAWRRLTRTGEEPHRARLIGDFLARHAGGAERPDGLPPRLAVFGCLNISPDTLRVLGTLGEFIEVDFLLPSPCAEYWGEERSLRERLRAGASPLEAPEQPLLASWGRVGREFFEQVFSYDEVQPADEQAVLREPSRAHLLGRIQADVLALRRPDAHERAAAPDPDDVSLRVHVCHSPLREVEVLHDRLLALFERDPSLAPRDVAVMLPDVAAYAPAVEAVFGALADGDPRRIPYTIADRSAEDEHPIVEAFLRLLGLPASRWSANEFLDLVAVPAVQRRLGFDGEALADLRHWLDRAGVRWGLDESTRVAFGAGRYRAFSWAEGIERLLLGLASGDEQGIAGVAPLPIVEGNAAATLGQALALLRELEHLAAAQRQAHPPAQWQAVYLRALAALFPSDGGDRDERRALAAIRGALAALAEHAAAGGCEEALGWTCVREFLRERLAEADPQQRFLAGGVSFCGMVPLRAIPFRVIAVLGLDDEAFPRREPALGISRLERELRQARRLGDRSVRDDDRYLFLQILTSADAVLHLSYVGRDQRSGKPREASALVGELLDVVARDYYLDADAARRALTVEHPLQPFARRVFDRSAPEIFTYRDEWRAAAAAGRRGRPQPFAALPLGDAAAVERLPLERLIEFWRHPQRAFLRDVLHLDLYERDELLGDDDPLALGPLEASELRRALVTDALERGRAAMREFDEDAQVRLQLPIGAAGAAAYRGEALASARVAAEVERWRRGKHALPPVSFELVVDGCVLECTLRDAYREGLLHWIPGRMHGRHWLRPWIETLALLACEDRERLGFDADAHGTLIALGKRGAEVRPLRGLDAAAARTELAALLDGWRAGQRAPLAFYPKAAWTYLEKLASAATLEAALDAARRQFVDGFESADAWTALALRDREPFADADLLAAFERESARVFGTLAGLVHEASR